MAATTILSRLNIPRHIVSILEGESLVNDASGLVIYKLAVVAVLTGAFSFASASAQFAMVSVGGVAIGILLAFVFIAIHRRLGDPFIEVITALITPYAAYIAAESLHVSGVLAVVAAGLVRGRYSPEIVSAEMRVMARSVWNVLVFVLNTLIFILIGIQLSDVMDRLGHYPLWQLMLLGAVISAVAIAVRFAWVFPVAHLPGWLSGRLHEQPPKPRRRELMIISWCGMRGIIFLSFFVIATTLAPLIRKLKVGAEMLLQLRKVVIQAERKELIRLWRENEISDEVMRHHEEILDYQEAQL